MSTLKIFGIITLTAFLTNTAMAEDIKCSAPNQNKPTSTIKKTTTKKKIIIVKKPQYTLTEGTLDSIALVSDKDAIGITEQQLVTIPELNGGKDIETFINPIKEEDLSFKIGFSKDNNLSFQIIDKRTEQPLDQIYFSKINNISSNYALINMPLSYKNIDINLLNYNNKTTTQIIQDKFSGQCRLLSTTIQLPNSINSTSFIKFIDKNNIIHDSIPKDCQEDVGTINNDEFFQTSDNKITTLNLNLKYSINNDSILIHKHTYINGEPIQDKDLQIIAFNDKYTQVYFFKQNQELKNKFAGTTIETNAPKGGYNLFLKFNDSEDNVKTLKITK